MVVFDANNVAFFDAAGNSIEKVKETITWSIEAAERGGYDHFMLKEIFEQPKALRDTISPRLKDGKVYLDGIDLSAEYLKGLNKICFVACGSAYYVAGIAKYVIEKHCRITTEIMMASEFRYCDPVLDDKCLVIAISQSGETADTLEAVREAKRRGARTLGIINVVGSAIAKATDQVIYTCAGPEIAVATTKGFTTQLAVVYLLTMHMAKVLGKVDDTTYAGWVKAMEQLPDQVASLLTDARIDEVKGYAQRLTRHNNAFYIGRNLDGATCLEGSLKLKEVAYIHSECYPAGELKHGPLSLIEDGYMVVALATIKELFDKTIANVREVRARGADVLCVTLEELADEARKQAQSVIAVPSTDPMIQPSLNIIPLQLLGYYIAVNRGCDVDKPRNLAKSVTVE
jgi:glucosamine--fructose-6-phosphate aminotransferase (isomerizing)